MSVWFIALMEKVVIACCEKTKKIRQWAWRHKCCSVLIAWPIVVNWDIWLAYTATPIRCAMMGDDRMQVFVTREEWQKLYPNPINIPEGEDIWLSYEELDDKAQKQYIKEKEYKGYTYPLKYISKKYPNLVFYAHYDWDKKYSINHRMLFYDNVKDKLIAVSYIIEGKYKIPIYDGYGIIGCDLTENWKNELRDYIETY